MNAAVHLATLFAELRKEREDRPASDLVSTLVSARVDGHPLTDMSYTMYMLLLATAGNETTRNAMSRGLLAFAQHPEQWQRLRENPTLLGSAVEEILRWSSPLLYFRRNAIQEMTIDGAVIEPGDIVSLWYVSANRDESVFENPEVFDIARDPNRQVAFGGGGVHLCLGASLARLELEVLFAVLLERVSKVTLAGDRVGLRSNFSMASSTSPSAFTFSTAIMHNLWSLYSLVADAIGERPAIRWHDHTTDARRTP